MSEEQKQETAETEPVVKINVPVQDLPSRADIRSILKSGKDTQGREVHPESVKMLRVARIADLFAFGQEVNKANNEIVRLLQNSLVHIDIDFKEVHWNFATFMSFLVESGLLKEGALEAFAEYKKKAEDELIKNSKVLLEQAEKAKAEAEAASKTQADAVRAQKETTETFPPADH